MIRHEPGVRDGIGEFLRDVETLMQHRTYAIIGSGKIGTVLAGIFALNKIEVGIANSRGPASLAALMKELGSTVVPQSLPDASGAEMIFLAVPFSAHKDVAKQAEAGTARSSSTLRTHFASLRKN